MIAMRLRPGQSLGPYEIAAALGAGGMGEVYRARDTRLEREVAVKVMPVRLAGDPQALARFTREAKAVAALSHPNILAIHDFRTDDGIAYTVSELLSGETLREALRRSPVAWRKAAEIGAALADGLAAAHSKGIVHRDLKPENIFLVCDGQVKILDFGVASIVQSPEPGAEAATLTQDGALLGTTGYMSPEQVRGDAVDARSDVFSLGCVLYEMLSGKRAFAGETSAQTLAATLEAQPVDLDKTIPEDLHRAVAHCLEKNPRLRFQSAQDVAFALRSALAARGADNGETLDQAVRKELDRILTSARFARNERMSRFLQHVVERHLEGRDDELKESLIAIEVFGRKPDHDPKQDSIVRTEAGRLRARLAEYYANEGADDRVTIELPKGGYVPVFQRLEAQVANAVPERAPRRRAWMPAAAAGLAIALAGGGLWLMHSRNAPIAIGVLPLENLSHNEQVEDFADGLTRQIITDMSVIEGLTVRSANSSFELKGQTHNVRAAAEKLRANYILSGGISMAGGKLRVTAYLVRTGDDVPVLSANYDRETADVFAIQDEIALKIVNKLRLSLGRGKRRYNTSFEAYDLYLRARGKDRVQLLQQAIEKDPTFAPAWAGLANLRAFQTVQYAAGPPDPEKLREMRETVARAAELDPLSAEVEASRAGVFAHDGQWEQAEASFKRAIELDPNRSETYRDYAMWYLRVFARTTEALQQLRIAEKNDPLSKEIPFELGDILTMAGRYSEAERECLKVESRGQCLGRVRMLQGRYDEAIRILGKNSNFVGYALARAGRREEAQNLNSARSRPNQDALTYAGLGDKDRTIDALERMAPWGPQRLGVYLNYPELAFLRDDPRIKALRKRVGLP